MKNFWILSGLMLLLGKPLIAQDTLTLYQLYPLLSDVEKAEWTAFLNSWNYFEYAALRKKHHIKSLDCKSCESFYAELYIEIDANGNISRSSCLRAMRCSLSNSDPELFADYERSVRKQRFHRLRNQRFIVRLGQVLKC